MWYYYIRRDNSLSLYLSTALLLIDTCPNLVLEGSVKGHAHGLHQQSRLSIRGRSGLDEHTSTWNHLGRVHLVNEERQ